MRQSVSRKFAPYSSKIWLVAYGWIYGVLTVWIYISSIWTIHCFPSMVPNCLGRFSSNFKSEIFKINFRIDIWAFLLQLYYDECQRIRLMISQHWFGCLVLSGDEPLTEPMFTEICVAIWRHYIVGQNESTHHVPASLWVRKFVIIVNIFGCKEQVCRYA